MGIDLDDIPLLSGLLSRFAFFTKQHQKRLGQLQIRDIVGITWAAVADIFLGGLVLLTLALVQYEKCCRLCHCFAAHDGSEAATDQRRLNTTVMETMPSVLA